MNDKKESMQRADEKTQNKPAAKNDGPDETPIYADLHHDEKRRNILEEGENVDPLGGAEKGDDL